MEGAQERRYQTRTTSHETTEVVQDIVLEEDGYEEDQLTRKVLRLHWVDNKQDGSKPLRGYILHQRRPNGTDTWEDVVSDLRRVKGGEEVGFEMGARHMAKLREALNDTYHIWQEYGRPKGEETFLIRTIDPDAPADDPRPARLDDILALERQHGEDFWGLIGAISDNLPAAVAWQRIQQVRAQALAEFEEQLGRLEWGEGDWQQFFQRNQWVFGYGLDYRFTHMLQREAVLAGADYQGRDEQRTDYLMATAGDVRFTVVVDIKTPQAALLHDRPYRNRAYRVSNEVAGGVAQVQAYCRNWETDGAQDLQNVRALDPQRVFTCEPKGILVIGRLATVEEDAARWQSFESYRRNLNNPDLITFDELLERARFIVRGEGP